MGIARARPNRCTLLAKPDRCLSTFIICVLKGQSPSTSMSKYLMLSSITHCGGPTTPGLHLGNAGKLPVLGQFYEFCCTRRAKPEHNVSVIHNSKIFAQMAKPVHSVILMLNLWVRLHLPTPGSSLAGTWHGGEWKWSKGRASRARD